MLSSHYRIQIANNTGVTATVSITAKRFKYASDALVYESSASTLAASMSVTTAGYNATATVDNTTNLYLGGDFAVEVTVSGSPSGTVQMRLQRSVDGGTTWPENGAGELISSLYITAAGTYRRTASVG